ncbi:hypothetical protein Tco_1363092 [Tanacetum coccineum]
MSYTSISSDFNPLAWGIPLIYANEEMDPYEEVAQQGQAAPPSPAFAPDPIELEDHVPVYVPEPEEDPEEDSEEDLREDPKEDPEEDSSEDDDKEEEEHLAPADSTAAASPVVDPVPSAEATEPFKTDESAVTPPPPPPPPVYRTISMMSIQAQAPIPFLSEAEIPSPPLHVPSPPTTIPTYTEAPLGYKAAGIRLRRLLLTAPTPRFEVGESSAAAATRQSGSIMTCGVDYSFVDTVDASIRASERRTMAAIYMVNLRVSYQAHVHRRESKKSYTRQQDAQRDHAALRGEVDTLRRYLSSLCTTHEQERVKACHALARFKAHNRALEARIAVLETYAHRHKRQHQDADDHATGHIMRIQELEAGACIDTLEDTCSNA